MGKTGALSKTQIAGPNNVKHNLTIQIPSRIKKKRAIYVMQLDQHPRIYGQAEQAMIADLVDVYASPQSPEMVAENPAILRQADIVLTGWGAPRMDQAFLSAAPNLQAVFYGAGSIRTMVTDAFWDRGIAVTSASRINGICVAEYVLSQILFSLKRGWSHALEIRKTGRPGWRHQSVSGTYGSTVGLISLGNVAQVLCELLRPFAIDVIAYDPYVSPSIARKLGVKLCSLEDTCRQADVVSMHAPKLEETQSLLTREHFTMMKPDVTFINTSRGTTICEDDLIDVLKERPDMWAVLDVAREEPPTAGSSLYKLHNVILTPHIAGAMGEECRRMGRFMVDELRCYLNGERLRGQLKREAYQVMA